MATTDLHMHILPFDYLANLPSATTGLACTATLIRQARAGSANTLLFDNGDFLHGNPMGDLIANTVLQGRREPRGDHPIVAVMRRLGVDAINLGNHDFDLGAEFLAQVLKGAPFPAISSNLSLRAPQDATAPRLAPTAQPFALLKRQFTDAAGKRRGLTIGVLGLMPPTLITGLRNGAFQAETYDIVETAQRMVPQLRGLGADLVIVLAHSGIGATEATDGMVNALVPLAQVPGIDTIIGGHAHQVFPSGGDNDWPNAADPVLGTVHGVPTVIPGFWGSHLGLVDLEVEQTAAGSWQVTGHRVALRPIARRDPESGEVTPLVAPDPTVMRYVTRLHDRLVAQSEEICGTTARRLHSYFALVKPSTALDVVHRAKAWWVAKAVAGTPLATLPILSAAAPFKAGGLGGPGYFTDIPAGPITRHGLADLYLFPNELCVLRMTGAGLADWLERAASVFNRIYPWRGDQPLIADTTPGYMFESLAGCDYEIDLSAPARFTPDGTRRAPNASRVRGVEIDGLPLGERDEVLLATTTFRADGGGRYPVPPRERIALEPGVQIREVIAAYLAEAGPLNTAPWASWRFAPIPGAAAVFPSAPAAPTLAQGGTAPIQPGALRPDGFRTYRLALDPAFSYIPRREVGAGKHLANPVRSGRKQP